MSTAGMQTSASAEEATAKFVGIPVKITNHLSVPVEIYDVFNPAASGQTVPYQYTKLGTIAAGATDTVKTIREVSQLEAMYTGTVPDLLGWYYHQFPVKLMSGTQFSFGNPPPLSYTINESDWKSMIQSFLFHKYAMANPSSALTNNLTSALKSSDPTSVNQFFAGTKSFSACTLSSWNAVMTWLTMFTSGWQGPYYLYEEAPSNPPQGYSPSLVATLNVVSSASGNSATLVMSSEDSSGKVTPLSPAQNSTVVMAGDGTMVDQNPGEDVSCTLTPVWMSVTQTAMKNNQPQTTYVTGPVVTGTVAGTKVVSSQTVIVPPAQSSDSSSSGGFFSSQTFSIICEVVGLLVGIIMIYELAEKRLSGKSKAEDTAKRTAKDKAEYDNDLEDIDKNPDFNPGEPVKANSAKISADAASVKSGYGKASAVSQKELLTKTLDSQATNLEKEIATQVENGLTPSQEFNDAVEKAQASFDSAQAQIDSGKFSDAVTTMTKAASDMQATLDSSAKSMAQSEIDTLKGSIDAINKAASDAKAMTDAEDAATEAENNPDPETPTDSQGTTDPIEVEK